MRDTARMDGDSAWPPPDPLGEALHVLRMDGAFYSRGELTAPWGIALDPMPGLPVVPRRHDGARSCWRSAASGRGGCTRGTSPSCRTATATRCAASRAPRRRACIELDIEHPSDRYEIIRHGGGGARRRSSAARCASIIPARATSSGSCRR